MQVSGNTQNIRTEEPDEICIYIKGLPRSKPSLLARLPVDIIQYVLTPFLKRKIGVCLNPEWPCENYTTWGKCRPCQRKFLQKYSYKQMRESCFGMGGYSNKDFKDICVIMGLHHDPISRADNTESESLRRTLELRLHMKGKDDHCKDVLIN